MKRHFRKISAGRTTFLLVSLLIILAMCLGTAGCTGEQTSPAQGADITAPALKETIDSVMSQNVYKYATWGMMAQDLDSGEVVLAMNDDMLFTPGSTTKVFTVSTVLETLGPDYRFVTPVYREDDTLILVASGDLAMGGRERADGTLEFTNSDHVDAGPFGSCILTETDPLSGLNDLAAQVAASGISSADDVIIDDRLFETMFFADDNPVTPIVINDNLIDITIAPGKEGEPAQVNWRPKSSAYTLENAIITGAAGSDKMLSIPDYTGKETITISGTMPLDAAPVNITSHVMVPGIFARSLFIDALENAGVQVMAPTVGDNPVTKLPEKDSYAPENRVAERTSPPFSEYAKVTLKVSQNLYANCLLGIMTAHEGLTNPELGIYGEGLFLESAGVDLNSLSLNDGEGSTDNRISPQAAIALVSYMAGTDNYEILKDAMPLFGVDGTLHSAAEPGELGYGQIHAKTGTSLGMDMSGNFFAYARGLLGYMKTANGTDLGFVIYVNNVAGLSSMEDIFEVISDVNHITVAMYEYL